MTRSDRPDRHDVENSGSPQTRGRPPLLGFQASLLHGLGHRAALAATIEAGVSLFELFLDREAPAAIGATEAAELGGMARAAGVRLQVHAPYGLPDNVGRPPFAAVVGLCRELGADRLTVHLDELQRLPIDAIDWQGMTAAGLWLGVENLCGAGACEPEDVLAWLAAVPADAPVGVTFDVGHANVGGAPLSRLQRLLAGLRDLGRRIVSVHLHDNDGTRDAHLVIGDGTIDFPPLLATLLGAGVERFVIERWHDRERCRQALLPMLAGA